MIDWSWYEAWLESELNKMDYSLSKPQKLAKAILELSDFYQKPNATPWDKQGTTAAYLTYFMPLNLIRQQAVLEIFQTQGPAEREFNKVLDFGSGTGTTEWSLKQFSELQIKELHCLELSEKAIALHKHFSKELGKNFSTRNERVSWNQPSKDEHFDLGIFQTSLNEISHAPEVLWRCKTLLFIEPATSAKARSLMALRQDLMKQGYHLWAPCTHHENCPLLSHSQRDWCHDRTPAQLPSWFDSLEKNLPIKNTELTFSYLIASQSSNLPDRTHQGRIVGDPLKEKGKVRQMVCRNDSREFLSWLKRKGDPTTPHRGDLVSSKDWPSSKAEIRLENKVEILWSRYSD